MINTSQNLEPHKPSIITSGVVEVVSFFDKMDPQEAVYELLEGEYVLIEDYYHNGLEVLKQLRNTLQNKYDRNSFQQQRKYRAAYKEASHKLLLVVRDHKLVVKKSPEVGWFEELYKDEDLFLIPFPEVQGLNSSWQWYINGLDIDVLDMTIHPYYGIYFPTRFDHLELFEKWLKRYKGKRNRAIDVGIGSGVLSFQLLKHGFTEVLGTDTNQNAIISVDQEKERLGISDRLSVLHGDLFANFDGEAELIVFNPPWLVAKHPLEEGIDTAIYYELGLFSRFFEEAKKHLKEDGRLVLLFSNLGKVVEQDVAHPIHKELDDHNRYQKVTYLKQNVKPSSKKTNRKDWRKNEKVELWELSHLN